MTGWPVGGVCWVRRGGLEDGEQGTGHGETTRLLANSTDDLWSTRSNDGTHWTED